MLPTLTALLLLAFAPATVSTGRTETTIKFVEEGSIPAPIATIGTNASGGFRGPLIAISNKWEECDLAEFAKAAREIAGVLEESDRLSGQLAIYRSPSATLRAEADEIDRRDTAIRAFRAQLDKCGWMAEPGAFDR